MLSLCSCVIAHILLITISTLQPQATASQLAEFFKSYGIGNVVEAKIIVDESGLSKG